MQNLAKNWLMLKGGGAGGEGEVAKKAQMADGTDGEKGVKWTGVAWLGLDAKLF